MGTCQNLQTFYKQLIKKTQHQEFSQTHSNIKTYTFFSQNILKHQERLNLYTNITLQSNKKQVGICQKLQIEKWKFNKINLIESPFALQPKTEFEEAAEELEFKREAENWKGWFAKTHGWLAQPVIAVAIVATSEVCEVKKLELIKISWGEWERGGDSTLQKGKCY